MSTPTERKNEILEFFTLKVLEHLEEDPDGNMIEHLIESEVRAFPDLRESLQLCARLAHHVIAERNRRMAADRAEPRVRAPGG